VPLVALPPFVAQRSPQSQNYATLAYRTKHLYGGGGAETYGIGGYGFGPVLLVDWGEFKHGM